MDTNQRTCLLYRSFIVLRFSTTLPWPVRVLLLNKGCQHLEISLSRYFAGGGGGAPRGHRWTGSGTQIRTAGKLGCTGLWERHAWPALSITLSGRLQKLLRFYWNVSILPWKYRRGCGQGNKQLYAKSNRLLAKNKSRRASEWTVRLTKNAWFLHWDCEALTYCGNNCIWLRVTFQCYFESFIPFDVPPRQLIFHRMPWIVLWGICWTRKLGVIRLKCSFSEPSTGMWKSIIQNPYFAGILLMDIVAIVYPLLLQFLS